MPFLYCFLIPFPVKDFRHILPVFFDVFLVLKELVIHQLVKFITLNSQLRQPFDYILHEMEPVKIV